MSEPFKFCSGCGGQNHLSAQFCQSCGAKYDGATTQRKSQPVAIYIIAAALMFGCCALAGIGSMFSSSSDSTPATRDAAIAPTTSSATGSPERMVLDDARVTVYVECTHQEWKQYKFRFIIKKPGSPLLAPILRQAGNPRAYSVFVNGVDTGDDFAFSPNIAAFYSTGDLIPATFVSRPLNGNVALGQAYHDLVLRYERGN